MDALWVYLDTGILPSSEEENHHLGKWYSIFWLMREVYSGIKKLSQDRYFRQVKQSWNQSCLGEI